MPARERRPVAPAPEPGARPPRRRPGAPRGRRGTGGRGRARSTRRPTQATRTSGSAVELPPHLAPDDRLEVAHHHRIRMRPGGGPDAVVGRPDVGDPVADRLVHRVLERAAPRPDRDARAPPSSSIRKTLSAWRRDVLLAHVDLALEAEERRDRRRGDAVLPGAGLRDDPRLAHALGEEPLAERVVDLVGAGVAEVLALQVDARAAGVLGQPLGEVERRRAARRTRATAGRPAPGRPGRAAPRGRPPPARGAASSASRARSGRRSAPKCPARSGSAAARGALPMVVLGGAPRPRPGGRMKRRPSPDPSGPARPPRRS